MMDYLKGNAHFTQIEKDFGLSELYRELEDFDPEELKTYPIERDVFVVEVGRLLASLIIRFEHEGDYTYQKLYLDVSRRSDEIPMTKDGKTTIETIYESIDSYDITVEFTDRDKTLDDIKDMLISAIFDYNELLCEDFSRQCESEEAAIVDFKHISIDPGSNNPKIFTN